MPRPRYNVSEKVVFKKVFKDVQKILLPINKECKFLAKIGREKSFRNRTTFKDEYIGSQRVSYAGFEYNFPSSRTQINIDPEMMKYCNKNLRDDGCEVMECKFYPTDNTASCTLTSSTLARRDYDEYGRRTRDDVQYNPPFAVSCKINKKRR